MAWSLFNPSSAIRANPSFLDRRSDSDASGLATLEITIPNFSTKSRDSLQRLQEEYPRKAMSHCSRGLVVGICTRIFSLNRFLRMRTTGAYALAKRPRVIGFPDWADFFTCFSANQDVISFALAGLAALSTLFVWLALLPIMIYATRAFFTSPVDHPCSTSLARNSAVENPTYSRSLASRSNSFSVGPDIFPL